MDKTDRTVFRICATSGWKLPEGLKDGNGQEDRSRNYFHKADGWKHITSGASMPTFVLPGDNQK